MRIERDIINQLKAWKEVPDRKPILLRGARQIGKTWAMETFGKECFKYCVKFDFDKQQELKSVFQTCHKPHCQLHGIQGCNGRECRPSINNAFDG